MAATKIFNVSAVGLITGGATPNKPIAARYPDAPAWPTEAYRKAAPKIKTVSVDIAIVSNPDLLFSLC
jgi:hypothetical protein